MCIQKAVVSVGQQNFNRQFIMIDFEDLDNPDFVWFTRRPEFTTYLVMRRHIWRSTTRQHRGCEQWYAKGYLTCGVSRAMIARQMGGNVTERTITNDIAKLLERGVIETIGKGPEQIFVLGKWQVKEGVHAEYFYLDRLSKPPSDLETFFHVSEAESTNMETEGQKPRNLTQKTWKEVSSKNREENRERIDGIGLWEKAKAELRLQVTRVQYDARLATTAAEFHDGTLVIICTNSYQKDWLENRLLGTIRQTLDEVAGQEVPIKFLTKAEATHGEGE